MGLCISKKKINDISFYDIKTKSICTENFNEIPTDLISRNNIRILST